MTRSQKRNSHPGADELGDVEWIWCRWGGFTSGWVVGGFSGVAWAYVCTQILPFYQ
jgi:hypothetical protein